MKFSAHLNVTVSRDGHVLVQPGESPNPAHQSGGPLYIGQVSKLEGGGWTWEIPIQHRTAVLEGRHHEGWVERLSPLDGVDRRQDAVHILVVFHWARGYVDFRIG